MVGDVESDHCLYHEDVILLSAIFLLILLINFNNKTELLIMENLQREMNECSQLSVGYAQKIRCASLPTRIGMETLQMVANLQHQMTDLQNSCKKGL